MSFNMKDYVSDDHIESIGEIAKSQSAIIQALSLDNSKLEREIERLNNIINELEKVLDENVELTYVHNGKRQFNKTLTEGGLLFRDYIKSKLQKLKGSDKE